MVPSSTFFSFLESQLWMCWQDRDSPECRCGHSLENRVWIFTQHRGSLKYQCTRRELSVKKSDRSLTDYGSPSTGLCYFSYVWVRCRWSTVWVNHVINKNQLSLKPLRYCKCNLPEKSTEPEKVHKNYILTCAYLYMRRHSPGAVWAGITS